MNLDLVIAHGNCPDGFCAAWVASRFWGLARQPEFHFALYGEPVPDVAGKDVLLVDFSYKRPVLDEIATKAKSVRVLDHHETAMRDLDGFPGATFDMERSGAGLAWAFAPVPDPRTYAEGSCVPAPWLVRYVQDADLWRFSLPQSREVRASYLSYPRTFEAWDELAARDVEAVAAEGVGILRANRRHVEQMADVLVAIDLRLGDGRNLNLVPTAWAPVLFADVREELLRRFPERHVVATLRGRPDGRIEVGLGSRRDGPHVGEIAQRFGGGGHQGAAGFVMEWNSPLVRPW